MNTAITNYKKKIIVWYNWKDWPAWIITDKEKEETIVEMLVNEKIIDIEWKIFSTFRFIEIDDYSNER